VGIVEPFERACEWVPGDCVNEPKPQGVAGVELLGGEKHLQCSRLTNEPRKALGASPAGDETQSGTAMSKDSLRASDSLTACERQVKPSAHAVAMNGGEGRGRKVGNRIHQALSHVREAEGLGAIQLGDLLEIGPGGEENRVAGDDELGGTFVCKIFDRYDQGGYASASQAIRAVIGEKPQNGNVFVDFNCAPILLIFDGWAQRSRLTNKIP